MEHLKNYFFENNFNLPHLNCAPLFFNSRKEKLTRAGINYIVKKYAKAAKNINPSIIPDRISCHTFRHSKAMHLLQAGVPLIYIRDILGHVSVTTTEIYAKADSLQKRKALEKAYNEISSNEKAIWEGNNKLIDYLKSF